MSTEYLAIHFEHLPDGIALVAQDELGTTELKRFLQRFQDKFPYHWDFNARWYKMRMKKLSPSVRERKRISFVKLLFKYLNVEERKIQGVNT